MSDEVKNIFEKAVELSENPDAANVNEDRTHYDDETPTEPRWYVVHTYSGYENKVKEDLEKTIENRNLQNLIFEVKYPTETVTETLEGAKKPKTYQRKVVQSFRTQK